MSEIEILNADTVKAMLLAMPEKLRLAANRDAVREISRIASEILYRNAPKNTGGLARSIGIKMSQTRWNVTGIIGIKKREAVPVKYQGKRRGFSGSRTPAKTKMKQYARPSWRVVHLVELGTAQRKTLSGANRGSAAATHFIQKTAQEVAQLALDIFESSVKKALNN